MAREQEADFEIFNLSRADIHTFLASQSSYRVGRYIKYCTGKNKVHTFQIMVVTQILCTQYA